MLRNIIYSLGISSLIAILLCATAQGQQTWRLTNNSSSDTLPQIARDSHGRTWVLWLDRSTGNYDVRGIIHDGTAWGTPFWVHTDTVDQHRCRIAYDSLNDRMWVAWDSASCFTAGYYTGGILQGAGVITDLYQIDDFVMTADDSGRVYAAWSGIYYPGNSTYVHLGTFQSSWNWVWTAGGSYYPTTTCDYEIPKDITVWSGCDPKMLLDHYYSFRYTQYNCYGPEINYRQNDSWRTNGLCPKASYWYPYPHSIAITNDSDGNAVAVYCDTTPGNGTSSLTPFYSIYQAGTFTRLTNRMMPYAGAMASGSLSGGPRPVFSWSDGHAIRYGALIGINWSFAQTITDTSLHHCVNPDNTAENDSIAWVCFQNDGEIYVSRAVISDTTCPSQDTIPPAPISTLRVGSRDTVSARLCWNAVGDDSLTGTATFYDIRYATAPISEAIWGTATQVWGEPRPGPEGLPDSFLVTGLALGTTYYFGIKVVDDMQNVSRLSNIACCTTAAKVPPAAVTTLASSPRTPTSVMISWTAVGGENLHGRAARYDLRYSTHLIDNMNWLFADTVYPVPAPQPAGCEESCAVTGLAPNSGYYFGIKVINAINYISGLSNIVHCTTLASSSTETPIAFKLWPDPAQGYVALSYQGGSGRPALARVYNVHGQLVRNIALTPGMNTWNLDAGKGRPIASGVYLVRFDADNVSMTKLLTVVR